MKQLIPSPLGRSVQKAVIGLAAAALLAAACAKEPPAGPGKLTNPSYTAAQFDDIAQRVFGPIYPYLAKQVVQDYGITEGVAVDAGCGPGYWAVELARITSLQITALDLDPEAVAISRRNIAAAGLEGRIRAVQGDIEALPFKDESVDLVVSRGSYPFWKNKAAAFRELLRVLKPGGTAYVGGGLGSLLPAAERTRIREIMDKEKIGPPQELEVSFEEMGRILRQAGIPVFKISRDEGCLCGLWVEFFKPAEKAGASRL
jgi:SAM-dependent methyltransferase